MAAIERPHPPRPGPLLVALDGRSGSGKSTLAAALRTRTSALVIDGAYSARPELADLYTLRVLLEVGRDVRRERLLRREGVRDRAEWEARWGDAEDLYFETVMPPPAFDLVLDGA